MPTAKTNKRAIPPWAWLFAAACFLIPVIAIGGAIPTGAGVGGAFYCLAVSRSRKKGTVRKLLHCTAATAVCWALFLGLAGGAAILQDKFPGLTQSKNVRSVLETQKANLSDIVPDDLQCREHIQANEATRKKIYEMAVRMRKHVEWAKERRSDRLAKGLDLKVSDRQIEQVKKMHEKQLDFTARFFKITRQQLDEIIAEGDRERWRVE